MPRPSPVLIVGAGIGGLAAAMGLAAAGHAVTVVEAASAAGGKMREVRVGASSLDAGPTVLTMRDVFEDLFAAAGTSLAAEVTLHPLDVLARHAWGRADRLDLHADPARTAAAIGEFAGAAEARGFIAFCARARAIHATLDQAFMRAPRGGPVALVRRVGWSRLPQLLQIAPFTSMWRALGEHFRDPRLRQLFGRYATYCGCSPFAAPATLMLVAHVEQEGVYAVEGGMQRLAEALQRAAQRLGVNFRFDSTVTGITTRSGRASGVTLATGEHLDATTIVLNADVNALSGGYFGKAVARAASGVPLPARSLSALTWAATARTDGMDLSLHNVFFSPDYAAEFTALIRNRTMAADPTVYVCAQDRAIGTNAVAGQPERLFCLINAPPTGDTAPLPNAEIARNVDRITTMLARSGLHLEVTDAAPQVTTPADFERLFPATGGALYGRAGHGWRATFERPGARSRVRGLYLAGGSVHPGPGVPMAALSGTLAAACIHADLTSRSR
jgi:1-hydroxycarotenoid 3,4-desaturase